MTLSSGFAAGAIAFCLILGLGGARVKIAAQQQVNNEVTLPRPDRASGMTLTQALAGRRSVREFSSHQLTQAQLGQLLWAAQGVTSSDNKRTAPSAGVLYPLELYVALSSGLYYYQPSAHVLERRTSTDLRRAITRAAYGQDAVAGAAAIFIIAADFQRTARKYGERAPRYVYLEAGHAAQNLLLQAVALGLGAVPIGAFDDEQAGKALALTPPQRIVYMIATGYPR